MKKEPGALIKVRVEDCEHGLPHITQVSREDVDVETDSDGNKRIYRNNELIGYASSSSVGYDGNPAYGENWDRMFGPKKTVEPEELN